MLVLLFLACCGMLFMLRCVVMSMCSAMYCVFYSFPCVVRNFVVCCSEMLAELVLLSFMCCGVQFCVALSCYVYVICCVLCVF